MQRSRSRSRDHHEKKHKKEKKQKKQKRDKQDRKQKKRDRSHSRERQIALYEQPRKSVSNWQPERKRDQQQPLPEKTHGICRRCKEPTFSLTTRTCSNCGYPKESRPAYFPVVKQVQVLDLVRAGKLTHNSYAPVMIQVVCNDRMGKRQRVKCCPSDSILDLKKLISAQIGTRPEKIRLQKANIIFKDHIRLEDYQIKDGMGLEMYYD